MFLKNAMLKIDFDDKGKEERCAEGKKMNPSARWLLCFLGFMKIS